MSIQLEITNLRPRVRPFCPLSELLVLLSEVLLLLFVGFNFKMSLKTSVDSYHVPPPKRIYITAPDTNFYVIFKTEFCAYIVQNTVLIHVFVFFFIQSQEEDWKVIYEALLLVDSRIYLELVACVPGAGFLTRAKSETSRTRALKTSRRL